MLRLVGIMVLTWMVFFSAVGVAATVPKSPQTFVMAAVSRPESLDPHEITGTIAANLVLNLYEGLTVLDLQSFTIAPGVAERWEISQDGRVYTFYLRKGARWSNGRSISADDFVTSWLRAIAKGSQSPNAYQFYAIANAWRYHHGEINSAREVGIRALGPQVLEVKLAAAIPYFLQLTALSSYVPLPAGEKNQLGLVTNGAFTMEPDPQSGATMNLRRNPHYWAAASVNLDGVRIHFEKDAAAILKKYSQGEIDYTGDVFLPDPLLSKLPYASELHIVPWLATIYLRLNCRVPPFDNADFRRALNLGLDRDAMLSAAGIQGISAAYSLVPRAIKEYIPNEVERFNLARAKEYLRKANLCTSDQISSSCRPLPAIEILTNEEGEQYLKSVEAVIGQWRRHLGITSIQMRKMPWANYLEAMQKGQYQVARSGWVADYADASSFLKLMLGSEGNNRTGYANREFDQLISKAETELSQSLRQAKLAQAEALLVNDMPIIPLYTLVKRYLLKPNVHGFYDNPLHHVAFKTLSLERKSKE